MLSSFQFVRWKAWGEKAENETENINFDKLACAKLRKLTDTTDWMFYQLIPPAGRATTSQVCIQSAGYSGHPQGRTIFPPSDNT